MSEAAIRLMSIDEFLVWQEAHEQRAELVDGRPVAMTGATFAHDRVVGNVRLCLSTALRAAGSQCDAFGADIGATTGPMTLRRPDVAVYCPPFDEAAAKSDRPRLIVEVLSRSTEQIDYVTKLEEYKTLSSLRTVLLIDPWATAIGVWERDATGAWQYRVLRDMDAVLELADLGISIPVRDVYERVSLNPAKSSQMI